MILSVRWLLVVTSGAPPMAKQNQLNARNLLQACNLDFISGVRQAAGCGKGV